MARKRNSITLRRRLRIAVRLLLLLVFAVLCYLQFRTLSRFSPTVPPCDDSSRRAPVDDLVGRLRASVTFLPLRDTRKRAGEWFISALNDSSEPEGEAKNLVLPSAASSGRVLCMHAPPRSDAAYALAWRDALPRGAALRPGLTFVSEMSYDYRNLWHGLSALVPFASWHARSGCRAVPARWALFLHGAAVRTGTSGWLASLAEAATGAEMSVETFPDAADGPACFEEAVVFRRQMEGLSRARLLGAFDFLRCKARARCGVAGAASGAGPPALRVTLLFRTGARAFRDEAAVERVFEAECARVAGCAVTAARSENLTFCDQVRLLSATDVLVTPHGAQLTNLLFMDRNSSVMEFYPLGWRQRAGGGQFVYRWMADRAGMRHEGSWWDPHGEPCPGSPDILSCYKNRQIGHDEAYFARWAARVFAAAKERKTRRGGGALEKERQPEVADCGCS
ncbi:hypothetical protein PAHAL_6G214400 [Panicum hallii]|jgi:hypothetical protein|uniref:Glycosyltransferase 61 catalytic domain-containing protein n=1 Tax=Panicum hallii TaxID=206008 RepID=A0A2S3I2S2_9POAL|nr:uncharacterized protein LOC112898289 [Panicum hallii]PAN35509.1 hypothetical protein PAHAL_6G214400 [Panicum hallii]